MDFLANVLETIEKIVDKGQGLTMLGGLAGGIFGATGHGFINLNSTLGYWKETVKSISNYNNIAKSSTTAANSFALSLSGTNAKLSEYLIAQNGATASTGRFIAATIKSTAVTVAQKVAITALNFAINAGIMMAITALIGGVVKFTHKNEELTESLQNAKDKLKATTDSLEDYKQKVQEIVDSEDSETEKLNKLYDMKKTLADQYGIEIGHLNDVADAREKVIDGIDEQIKKERQLYVDNPENRKAYELAKKKLNDKTTSGLGAFIGGKDVGKILLKPVGDATKTIGDDVKSLFDDISRTSKGNYLYNFNTDGMDEADIAKLLEDKIFQFDRIKYKRKLTDDEQALFDSLYEEYNTLNEKNKEYIENLDFAKAIAQNLIDTQEQGDKNIELYFAELSEASGWDKYVIKALEEILMKTDEVVESGNRIKQNSPLPSILSELSDVNNSISDMTEKIKTVNEQFEDLDKIIKNNEDTDKFFTSSEIIDILEKYPSLNNAIHETTYGYKIEADALEALRAAKLEEQKTALETEMFETNARLNSARAKIKSYESELVSVNNLGEAKTRLAELEAKYAELGNDTTNPYYNNGSLSALIGDYKDYISATEEAKKHEEQLDVIDAELQVLGKHHKDASDSKKDETEATNKLKEANKELTDEYKKAQEAIDDLLKLTMEYLKKNKELQKDALKEQLDNFKKLIEKRKELIKLEKDQYDFEKDLKEQNRDLLEIQQELDSLSVEGADYSLEDLKRKEELQKQYVEQSEKRDDFLYDHEVETRTKALEDEEEAFEDNINTQIKAIEDYLKYEGRIRSDAVDLINGKTQAFYNDLVNYTMDYTDKSRFEFDKLWTDAYAALEKYGNGQIDVDMTLAFLIGRLKELENELTEIEKTANSTKHSVSDMAKDAAEEVGKLESRLVHVAELISKFGNPPTLKISDMNSIGSLMNANAAYGEWMKNVKAYHTGGVVEGISTKNGEVLAKLLSGEVVVTQQQTDNFLKKTLPQIATSGVANNQFAPVINLGDINISGNADQSVIDKLKAVQKDIADSVLKAVNNQTNIYNGGRVRFV